MTATHALPNFIIAGAPKAGTSSLFTWIADHPYALGSRDKETYFFVDPDTHMFSAKFNVKNGVEGYDRQFPIPAGARPRVVLEATPSYLYMASALKHVPDLESHPRCLFLLREPSAQIFSLYEYFRNNWDWIPADMGFEEFLVAVRARTCDFKGNELAQNAIRFARYVDYLVPWRERLGTHRMMVMTFDELASDNVGATIRVAEWLGLDSEFYKTYRFPRENETYVPRSRAVQKVNLMIRASLPKGRIYKGIRTAYRKLNTEKPAKPDTALEGILESLRGEFEQDNIRLAREFDLDLRNWSGRAA